jgi:beta-carotene ketolase (CrtW type)
MRHTTIQPTTYSNYRWRGLLVAGLVLGGWGSLLAVALRGAVPWGDRLWGAGLWVALLTWAYTGVFITAHDAMHGLVAPKDPRLNHAVGWVALGLYAGMSYGLLRGAHGDHHAYPSTGRDPDYHEPTGGGFVRWFAGFVWRYMTVWQVVVMAAAFNALHHLGDIPLSRLWAFWITPQVLSTLQLFVVGTWLPHREGAFEGEGPTKARTVGLPWWGSLLACYHFGYHYEHHAWPFVPWWRLGKARAARLSGSGWGERGQESARGVGS